MLKAGIHTPPGRARHRRRAPAVLRLRRGLGGAVAALALLTGCAYYNTFYHARKFYAEAETIRETDERSTTAASAAIPGQNQSAARTGDLYKKSIDKCRKLIENFPDSRWVDDAYVLMAKAYYGKGDYLSARRELDRFVEQFPKSELIPGAMHWRGLTAFAQEDFAAAESIWRNLLESYPKFEDREEVEFNLARTLERREMVDEAIQAYTGFLERHPKGEFSIETRILLGQLQLKRHQYAEAERVFTEVTTRAPDENDRVKGKLLLGEALEAQDRHEEALEMYQDLELKLDPNMLEGRMTKEERDALIRDEQQRLAEAREDSVRDAQFARRDSTGAIVPGSGASSADPDEDRDELEDPNGQAGGVGVGVGGQGQLATGTGQTTGTRAASAVASLNPRRHMLEARDIRYDQLARVMLREGVALAAVGKPVEAILAFEQVIAEYPRTAYASEAQYRIGYVYEVNLEDFDGAQKAYGQVASQGRSSFTEDAARRARNLAAVKNLAGAPADSLSKATASAAEGRFLRAELYLFQQDKPERAVEEYVAIQQDFSGTEHAAKAALAEAWVRVNSLADTARGRAKYAEVMRVFPDTEYGRRASRVLRGPERELKPEEFAGPSLAELLAPENLAAVSARDSILLAQEREIEDQARAAAVQDSISRAEAAQAQAAAEEARAASAGESGAPPPGGPGVPGPGAPGQGPERGSPRRLSPDEITAASLPRGQSGKLLDPMAVPADGWTPVLGLPPDSTEIRRRVEGSGRRVIHTMDLPQQPDSVMAKPLGVVPESVPEEVLAPADTSAAPAPDTTMAPADTVGSPAGLPADTPTHNRGAPADSASAPADSSGAPPPGREGDD